MVTYPEKMEDFIKAEACSLGFVLCGITLPAPLPGISVFETWLNEGHQARMTYLAEPRSRHLRTHPAEMLPGCRSIILLGYPYSPVKTDPSPTHGDIAAYAQGTDYHHHLPLKLGQLVKKIHQFSNSSFEAACFTDSAPVLERELGQLAGLGWIGKNSCLISQHTGSYFLLAEIFTTLVLAPDTPFQNDLCGRCQRCIENCPTGCILPNRTLDSNRCLAYLTIENKGEIPLELRPAVGNMVFGCDICQAVCPWNAQLIKTAGVLGQPVDLLKSIQLTNEQFKEKYGHTPIERARRRGVVRNVAVALGNQGRPEDFPALLAALEYESEPLVRQHIVWAIGCSHHLLARQALINFKHTESDENVQIELDRAIAALEPS
jgi:epoxyqueuosine reductase